MGSVVCTKCNAVIDDRLFRCPNCKKINAYIATPVTIKDFIAMCQENNFNYLGHHYMLGVNSTTPKCFGIYQDGDKFIVYKNKSNGERAVRYSGNDESEAVKLIFDKFYENLRAQYDSHAPADPRLDYTRPKPLPRKRSFWRTTLGMYLKFIIAITILQVILVPIRHSLRGTPEPYYCYEGIYYFLDSDIWYYYDDYYDEWYEYYGDVYWYDDYYEVPYDDFYEIYGDSGYGDYDYYYYDHYYDTGDYGGDYNNDDWDNDWDDDWGDWDNDFGDWDSDW